MGPKLMDNSVRLIPAITIIEDAAVKTVAFSHPKYLGDPFNVVAQFSEMFVDELLIIDIGESRGSPQMSKRLLSNIASRSFMPIGYGGRIRDLNFAQEIMQLGFDKMLLRTGLENPVLVSKIAGRYGQQALSAVLDVEMDEKNGSIGRVNGRKMQIDDLQQYCIYLQNLGVGEIVLHDIFREGTFGGIRLLNTAAQLQSNLNLSILVMGGLMDFSEARQIQETCHIGGVVGSSAFLLERRRRALLVKYPEYKRM